MTHRFLRRGFFTRVRYDGPVSRNYLLPAIAAALCATVFPGRAQPRVITAADYARAEKLMSYNTAGLMYRASVQPNWLPGDRMWYRVNTAEGSEFILVDPNRGTREPAFDHAKLAAALSKATGSHYDAAHLPFQSFTLSPDSESISVTVGSHPWKCDRQGNGCVPDPNAPAETMAGGQPAGGRGGRGGSGGEPGLGATSPDGRSTVFIRDNNLWVTTGGKDTQLTTDGVKDFGYATDNSGWTSSDRP